MADSPLVIDPSTVTLDTPVIDAGSVTLDAPNPNPPVPEHEDPALKAQWASGSAVDRITMMIPWIKASGLKSLWNDTPVRPIIKAGLQGGGAALGGVAGDVATGGSMVGVIPGGAAGAAAGNALAQKIDVWAGSQDGVHPGEVLGAAATGAVPISSLAGAPVRQIIGTGAKLAASNVASKTAETLIDESRTPTLGEAAIAAGAGAIPAPVAAIMDAGSNAAALSAKKALYAVRDATLDDARKAGYVIPSSKVNPSAVNNVSESFAGKAAVAQKAAIQNQDVTDSLARAAIGLPPDQPITPAAIQGVRDEAGKAYQAVAALSPAAADDLEALKQARYDKNLQYSFWQRSGNPEAFKAAEALGTQANALETKLAGHAAANPALLDDLKDARVLIAKTYQVENALNAADGHVSASVIGRSFDKGNPLTDELATIGKFQQAFPQFARDAGAVPSPGVGKTKAFGSLILSGAGSHMLGPAGAVVGAALPFSDGLARSAVLSRAWQNSSLGRPNYGIANPDLLASIARFATQAAGRQTLSPQAMQFLPQSQPAPQLP